MAKDDFEDNEGMSPVKLPSGALFYVHEKEVTYFQERSKRYQKDNSFVNVSDLMDLDRLLVSELLCHRWGTWLSQQRDYWGDPVDENLQKALREHSGEIRQLKKNMGIDRETREKQRGEDSVDSYLAALKQRARHFGHMREEQLGKALELFQQLKAVLILHKNCDEKERVEQKCRVEDIMQWLNEEAIPEFDEIDAHFREHDQKLWIRKQ